MTAAETIAFPKPFGDGGNYVCDGDTIELETHGLRIVAEIVRDDSGQTPDSDNEGFWPSSDPDAAGWIGPDADYDTEYRWAQRVYDDWAQDDWWFVGVRLSVYVGEHCIDKHAASCWGVECNYPTRDGGRDNSHLNEIANELISEALESCKPHVDKLRQALENVKA